MQIRNIAVCGFVFTLLPFTALAQDDRAVVTGTITDQSQAAIAGVIVEIDSKAKGFHQE